MAETTLRVVHRPDDFPRPKLFQDDARFWLGQAAKFFENVQTGGTSALVEVQLDGGNATAAAGTLTIATGATGNVGVTVNGVAISVAATGVASTDAANVAAAVRASVNPLVAQHVTASSALGVVTVTALRKGTSGNAITFATAGGGTGMTISGPRLTGGTDATPILFDF